MFEEDTRTGKRFFRREIPVLSKIWVKELKRKSGGGWIRTNVDRSRGVYSPLQLATMRHPQVGRKTVLAVGIEPTTVRLQVGCSTN